MAAVIDRLQQVLDELQQVRQQNSSLQAMLDDVLSVLPPPCRTLTTGQAAHLGGFMSPKMSPQNQAQTIA